MTCIADQLLRIELAEVPGRELVCVRLSGEIDMRHEGQLSSLAAAQLGGCQVVCLDVQDVPFAGTAFLHFLAAVLHGMPEGGCLMVCRPQPLMTTLLNATGMDRLVSLHTDLPLMWMMPERA